MSLKISRILHAGYLFETDNTQIAFDTIFENPFSKNCYAYPNVSFDTEAIQNLKLNAVFISHYHDDHCSMDSLKFLNRETPIYMFCLFEEMFTLIRNLGFTHVYPLEINIPIVVGDLTVTPRRALDADVDCIFQICTDEVSVLNVVDSWIDDDTLELLIQCGPWDVLLWPFQTMQEIEVLAPTRALLASRSLPIEWTEQIKKLKPKVIVPSSCQFIFEDWSWYNHGFFPISYKNFEQEIRALMPTIKIIRMNPSVSIEFKNSSFENTEPLHWIKPIGKQEVDYEYIENFKPTKTSDISKHFDQLNSTESKRVIEFCENGLIVKYKSMDPPLDPFFSKSIFWKLSIYDHQGMAKDLYYKICGNYIERTDSQVKFSWLTEISIAKLFAALENGESLTSIYMRINDFKFEPDIENEIASVDVMEDPLIRCLYNGEFASYQKAQLRRINKL